MSAGDQVSAYRWLLAWGAIILILIGMTRFKIGYVIVYYLAALTLLFIVLTQYQGIAWVLAPFNNLPNSVAGQGAATNG